MKSPFELNDASVRLIADCRCNAGPCPFNYPECRASSVSGQMPVRPEPHDKGPTSHLQFGADPEGPAVGELALFRNVRFPAIRRHPSEVPAAERRPRSIASPPEARSLDTAVSSQRHSQFGMIHGPRCDTYPASAPSSRRTAPHSSTCAAPGAAPTEAMKTPEGLQPLLDDGVIDEVIRSLKSGKEATVYMVRAGVHTRCAKVYRSMAQRSFKKRAQYQEGRKVRGSRQARAISKSSHFGRREQEAAWKNAEVAALYQLVAAGVRVPQPHGYFDGVLIMELVVDAEGKPAPRLGEVELSAEIAREYHRFLIGQVVRMLCVGLIHGDLSEFNVLVSPDGPVIIDLPQVVNAAGNNAALAMLERDVNNLRSTLGRFAPELLATEFAREMWALFEKGELRPDSALTGVFAVDETATDPGSVMLVIDDARAEEMQRRLRLAG